MLVGAVVVAVVALLYGVSQIGGLPQMSSGGEATTLAYVNAPGDLFLSLRSEPSATSGARLDHVPHGAEVAVGPCQDEETVVDGRRGRWCPTDYGARRGWVFDGFLVDAPQAVEPEAVRAVGRTLRVYPPGDSLNVRDAPALDSDILTRAGRGAEVRVEACVEAPWGSDGIDRRWCRTRVDGQVGWTSDRFLFETVRVNRRAKVQGTGGALNLREVPSANRDVEVLAEMPEGVTVSVSSCLERLWDDDPARSWCRVDDGFRGGWALREYLVVSSF